MSSAISICFKPKLRHKMAVILAYSYRNKCGKSSLWEAGFLVILQRLTLYRLCILEFPPDEIYPSHLHHAFVETQGMKVHSIFCPEQPHYYNLSYERRLFRLLLKKHGTQTRKYQVS